MSITKRDIINYGIALVILLLLFLFFWFKNRHEVSVNIPLIRYTLNSSMASVLIASTGLGALIMFFVTFASRVRKNTELKLNRQRIQELEKKVEKEMTKANEIQAILAAGNKK